MAELTDAQIDYLDSQKLGRIATTGADGRPHVVPSTFRYNPETNSIDVGGMRVAQTKKYRDVQANPAAAIVVDDLESVDPWKPRMLEVRGRAEAISEGGEVLGGGFGAAFIRIHVEKVNAYGID
jgi:pyridoxamine 5'-phosphate oxidase family protein